MKDAYLLSEIMNECGSELLLEVLDNIQDAVLIVDTKGVVSYVNAAYKDVLGVVPEKIVGRNLHDIEPDAMILKVVETQQPVYNKVDYITSLQIDSIGISFPIYGGNHKQVVGAVSIFNNITKYKQLTEDLQKSREIAAYLKEQLDDGRLPRSFNDVIAQSTGMKEVLTFAAKIARTDSTILIRGESGVGKEVMANAIHNASSRKDEHLVKVNCASIPESLLESELFGYEEGAFTGARKGGKIGRFELANEGTIFLDEIGDMSFDMQSKLLRVIQEKELERVGGVKTIPLNVRIIAATNKDLERMMAENTFRSDLYYRLNVMPLTIPPLRERREDIIPLARRCLKNLNGTDSVGIAPSTIKVLQSYDWPGNVRELQNVIEHANILRADRHIWPGDLPKYLRKVHGHAPDRDEERGLNLKHAVALLEKELMAEALRLCAGNKSRAIEELGISRRAFYEKLERYGLTASSNAASPK